MSSTLDNDGEIGAPSLCAFTIREHGTMRWRWLDFFWIGKLLWNWRRRNQAGFGGGGEGRGLLIGLAWLVAGDEEKRRRRATIGEAGNAVPHSNLSILVSAQQKAFSLFGRT